MQDGEAHEHATSPPPGPFGLAAGSRYTSWRQRIMAMTPTACLRQAWCSCPYAVACSMHFCTAVRKALEVIVAPATVSTLGSCASMTAGISVFSMAGTPT